MTPTQRKYVTLASLGGALEFYDFIIFMYLSHAIGVNFFPVGDHFWSIVSALFLFALSCFIRPLGGFIFGHMGDTQGRKKTFLITLSLMVIPTFLFAILPTYEQIGLLAPILLITLRMMQGLAVGGELPSAFAFASEHAGEGNTVRCTARVMLGIIIGVLLGQTVVTLLKASMNEADFMAWGWRIPFAIGGVFGLFAFYLRRRMAETPAYKLMRTQFEDHMPLLMLWQQHKKNVLLGVAVASLLAVSGYGLIVYIAGYFAQFSDVHDYLEVEIYLIILMLCEGLVFYFLASFMNRFSPYTVLKYCTVGLGLFAWPIYYWLSLNTLLGFLFAGTATLGFVSVISMTAPAVLLMIFPTEVRCSGVAASYNLAYALFGGLTPLMMTLLYKATGFITAPSIWVVFAAGLSLFAVLKLHQKMAQ